MSFLCVTVTFDYPIANVSKRRATTCVGRWLEKVADTETELEGSALNVQLGDLLEELLKMALNRARDKDLD